VCVCEEANKRCPLPACTTQTSQAIPTNQRLDQARHTVSIARHLHVKLSKRVVVCTDVRWQEKDLTPTLRS
jgi:hypothetical protein